MKGRLMHDLLSKLPTKNIFNVPVKAITMERLLDIIHICIKDHYPIQIGVVNAAKLVNMGKDRRLRDDVLSSDLIVADGEAVVWASRLLGQRLPQRVTGIDMMYGMLNRGNQHGYRVYCLGAKEEISLAVAKQIAENYPGVKMVGRHHGYFTEEDEPGIAAEIQKARPDILFVAITSPKKENFLAKWSSMMDVPICHGVGGSFDVMGGKVARAPKRWQKLGLEWLYRLKQEPKRLWRRYFVTNTLFISKLVSEIVRQRLLPIRKLSKD
jgi:N-acetylglucosaminyldiphosphoundecaprenol N-acetyl-beta-D-mannosaminyltransferase